MALMLDNYCHNTLAFTRLCNSSGVLQTSCMNHLVYPDMVAVRGPDLEHIAV